MKRLRGYYGNDPTGTSLGVFLLALPFGFIGVYLPLYGRALGASAFEVGALFSAFSLAGVLARPLVGIGADRYGRRPFLLAGAAFYVLSALLLALSVSLPLLFTARLAQGIGSALFFVAAYALIADVSGENTRGRTFGRFSEAANAGAILGTVASYGAVVALGIVLGWRVSFALYAATSALALLLFYRRIPRHAPSRRAPVARQAGLPTLLFLICVAFATAVAYSLVAPVVLLYLQDRFQAGEFLLGVAYAPAALVHATLPARLGSLGDRHSRKGIMALALLSSGGAALLFPLAPSLWVLSAVWVLEAALISAAIPAQDAIVSEISGGDVRGRAYGYYAAATGLGAAAGPLLGGWFYDNVGRSSPFWINAAILAVAAGLYAWKLPQSSVRAQSVPLGVEPSRVREVDSPA